MKPWVSHFDDYDLEIGKPLTRQRADGSIQVRTFFWALNDLEEEACRKKGPHICAEATYSARDLGDNSPHLKHYARIGDGVTPAEWPLATRAMRATWLLEDMRGRNRLCGRGSIPNMLPAPPEEIVWGPKTTWRQVLREARENSDYFQGICAQLRQKRMP